MSVLDFWIGFIDCMENGEVADAHNREMFGPVSFTMMFNR